MLVLPIVTHPHPAPAPRHRHPEAAITGWRTHLRAEDVPAVLAAIGAGPAAEVVAVHLCERAVPSVDEAADADAEGDGGRTVPDWQLELLCTLEPRPAAGPPPWPVWRGVGGGGTVVEVEVEEVEGEKPRSRRRLLPEQGVGTHQRGAVSFLQDPGGATLLAPPDVVARLEARCGTTFAPARTPALDPLDPLDPSLTPTPRDRAARAAGEEGEPPHPLSPPPALVAYRWPAGACPVVARVRLAWVWRPASVGCALLLWPDGAPAERPQLWRYAEGLPGRDEDGALTRGLRAVLGVLAGGGRPPAFASRDQFLRVVGAVAAELARRHQPVTAAAVRQYLELHAGHSFDAAHWTRLHQRYGFARWRDVLRALPRASNR